MAPSSTPPRHPLTAMTATTAAATTSENSVLYQQQQQQQGKVLSLQLLEPQQIHRNRTPVTAAVESSSSQVLSSSKSWDEQDVIRTSRKALTTTALNSTKKRSCRISHGSIASNSSYRSRSGSAGSSTGTTTPILTLPHVAVDNDQQQQHRSSYQQLLNDYPSTSNKLPATPSSISRRKLLPVSQRISSSPQFHFNPQHLYNNHQQQQQPHLLLLTPRSPSVSFADVATDTAHYSSSSNGDGSSSAVLETPKIMQQQQQQIPPPELCLLNNNNSTTSVATSSTDNNETAKTPFLHMKLPLSSSQQQNQIRRKSKRSLGTCTTVASSSSSTVTETLVGVGDLGLDSGDSNNNIDHHHHNESMDDENNDDDDGSCSGSKGLVLSGGGGTDNQSVDTNDTVTKNFRFTSFPASLPRINNQHLVKKQQQYLGLPQTIRKHMTFGSERYHHHHHHRNNSISNRHIDNDKSNNDSHNTSLSSWCNNQDQQHLGYSDDDDDDDDNNENTLVGFEDENDHEAIATTFQQQTPRARLNFYDPIHDEYHDENNVSSFNTNPEGVVEKVDPYISAVVGSNIVATPAAAATVMTTTAASISSSTPPQSPITMFGTRNSSSGSPYNDHKTIQLQFQLEEVVDPQCSPIPPIPEEGTGTNDDDDISNCMNEEQQSGPYTGSNQNNNFNSSSSITSRQQQLTTNDETSKKYHAFNSNNSSIRRIAAPTTSTSFTSGGESTTTTASQMTATTTRPLPDIHAFEDITTSATPTIYDHPNIKNDIRHHHQEDSSSRLSSSSLSSSSSQRIGDGGAVTAALVPAVTVIGEHQQQQPSPKLLVCPPTPVRIHPIFRSTHSNNSRCWGSYTPPTTDQVDEQEQLFQLESSPLYCRHQYYRPKAARSDSLIATKMIATCSSPYFLFNETSNSNNNICEKDDSHRHTIEQQLFTDEMGTDTMGSRAYNNGKSMNNDKSDIAVPSRPASSQAGDIQQSDCSLSNNPKYTTVHPDQVANMLQTSTKDMPVQPEQPRMSEVNISFSNNFDVISTLGSGTFADVYKVQSKADGRLYAIKRNRRQFRGRRDREVLLSEVRCMQRIQNDVRPTYPQQNDNNSDDAIDCVARSNYVMYLLFFYQAWQEDGHIFCQTELCSRDTCRDMIDTIQLWDPSVSSAKFPTIHSSWIHQLEPLSNNIFIGRLVPEMVIWKICHDICAGLSHLHSKQVGLVHNDIKPSNILFVKHPQYGVICKIGDFGMARNIGSTEDGQEGDQKYMALEMLEFGASYPSADMFSLGLTLYEMTSNIHVTIPPDGHRWHELRSGNINSDDFPSSRNLELIQLIRSMMHPNVTCRPSADEILSKSVVRRAGSTRSTFLYDYISDVEMYDKYEEQCMLMHGSGTCLVDGNNNNNNSTHPCNNMNSIPFDEQTPRNASIRPMVCFSPAAIHNKLPPLPLDAITATQQQIASPHLFSQPNYKKKE